MPGSFTVTTTGLQSATLLMDGGTKPGTTGHYLIKRKPHFMADGVTTTPFADYLVIYKTTEATVYDHPRSQNTAGVVISWDYNAYAYITATSSDDSGIAVTINSIHPVTTAQIQSTGIAAPTNAQIDYSGVTEPTTSAGTFSNTYIAQAEAKPVTGADVQETWAVTGILPLAASSA